jgi:predicted hotdog family 3-hydroxylacyl-ACP dehydratase
MIPINRSQIAAMIPHAGSMCLLDSILSWDATSIRSLSSCHKRRDNPMRRADGSLGVVCGVEIAAQAMAAHGCLTATNSGRASQGYLTSVRDLCLRATRLDTVDGEITVDAKQLMADDKCAAYYFSLTAQGAEFASGRATILLDVVTK